MPQTIECDEIDDALFSSYASTWRVKSDEDVIEWAARKVIPPGSARSPRFDGTATPWLLEAIRTAVSDECREMVALMPTGAGKTTIFDVTNSWEICEDPGSILQTLQNDEEADAYWEERMLPILENIPEANLLLNSLQRSKKKRGLIVLPSMTFYCSSLKLRALQRKSVRRVKIDEAWLAPHGFIAEARARMHDRWNRIAILVSQGGERFIEHGGEIVRTELEEAWLRTDQREFSMVCPECGHVSPWAHANCLFEKAETSTGDIDERSVMESARYKCPGPCGTDFPDKIDVRRSLSTGSIYIPTNAAALPRHVGFHVNGYALYYVPWGERALRWRRAQVQKRHGNLEPLRVIIQKDFAEFWEDQEHRFAGISNEAPPSEYVLIEDQDRFPGLKAGFPWPQEEQRYMASDYQELDGGYFPTVAAAFSGNGVPKLLFAGRLNNKDEIRKKQIELGITGKRVGIDCAHDTPTINDICREFDWLELLGSDTDDWAHRLKSGDVIYLPWSFPQKVGGIKNPCYRAQWSNSYFHNLHARKLLGGSLGYKVPADIEDTAVYVDPPSGKPTGFWPQMRANYKTMKERAGGKRVEVWERIGKRPDHYRDACCMLLVMAGIGGCLGETYERKSL